MAINKKKKEKLKNIQYITGGLILIFSIYLSIAFVSFLSTGNTDQSRIELPASDFFLSLENNVNNIGGKQGAYLSHLFINQYFGLPSFLIMFLLAIIGLRLLGLRIYPLRKLFINISFMTIWLSITISFLFYENYKTSHVFLGGLHGHYINEWLISLLGRIGTSFLLVATLVSFLILSFNGLIEKIAALFNRYILRKEKEQHIEEVKSDLQALDDLNKQMDSDIVFQAEYSQENKKEDIATILSTEIPTKLPSEDKEKEEKVEMTVVQNKDDIASSISQQPKENYDPTLDLSTYRMPSIDLLKDHKSKANSSVSQEELISNKNTIVETLSNYKIEITKIKATIGPTITLYEIVPAPGIRISKIKNLEDDIALSLAALGIRIIAPIPGKGTIGIEVPNSSPEIVSMRSVINSKKFQNSRYELPIVFGKTISNESYVIDLAKTPHMLVAGATGQGKSVGLNAIITSLIYKKHPSQLKFVFVDPKKVELTLYAKIEKHFLAKLPDEEEPIITDVQKVIKTLNSITIEMDLRYNLLKKAYVRNIKEYNEKFIKRQLNPENGHRYLPYIVVIIDEFADLIMTAGKEVETPIARIAQLARAIGIHMIIATQRPSTNIITGVIKANFPSRVAFKVASMIDSRTILDSPGANQLIGRGDMLITEGSDLIRVQCAFVDTPEVDSIVEFIEKQQSYPTAHLLPEVIEESSESNNGVSLEERDSLFEEAARLLVAHQQGSTSLIQRKFSIGYNRAGRIVDQLEKANIIGPFEGSKARQVLIADEMSLEQIIENLP